MDALLGTLVLVVLVGGYLLYERQRRARQRDARRQTLDRFFDQLERDPEAATSGWVEAPEHGPGAATTFRRNPPAPGGGRVEPLAVAAAATTDRLAPASGRAPVPVVGPDDLPDFSDVGGMDGVKAELDDTIRLILDHPDRARAYGVEWNGILLHGPPGAGKTHLVRAMAGQYRCSLLHVSTGDLVSGVMGESAGNVQRAFEVAAANRPCVLFFDEFDSIAQRRDAGTHPEERRTVNQLLRSLEDHREHRDLVVVAATNDLEHLDPAAVRPGRFDRHIRLDLPDRSARRAILAVSLADRPTASPIDLDELARRTAGLSAAAIAGLVDAAALAAFREAAASGELVRITGEHLATALDQRGGDDRPTVEDWGWDRLVLPEDVVAELQQLEVLLTDRDLADRLGIDAPRGVLLAGPPGTGKTTIARVLAAQARCSFYPVSAADVTSRWMGESERSIQRLFERAREHRPSIVFLDEIDALGRTRGAAGQESHDRQLTQLLTEIDGLAPNAGILVIGATNRPDALDPALTRGGRLSRRIDIELPDEPARWAILETSTRRMPTVGVDLSTIAALTGGFSGGDLRSLCQQAAVEALVRTRRDGDTDASMEVTALDFQRALTAVTASVEARCT